MAYERDERVRREIEKRMQTIGMAVDVSNDDRIVREVARELGVNPKDVARELNTMRLLRAAPILQRFGIKHVPQPMLQAFAASASVAGQTRERQAQQAFQAAMRQRRNSTTAELIDQLGESFDEDRDQRMRDLYREGQFEVERP